MRWGICTGIENAQVLKSAGYDYIELAVSNLMGLDDGQFAEVVAELERVGLRAEACNVFLPGTLPVVGPDVDVDAQAAYVQEAMARVKRVGAEVVVFGSGRVRTVPDGFSRDEAKRQVMAFSRLAADAAARAGLRIALEPLNTSETNMITSVAEGYGLVQEVGHPAFCLLADLYHIDKEGQPHDEVVAAADKLIHVHVAEAPSRAAPGHATNPAPYQSLFAHLKKAGYDRRCSVEGRWGSLPDQAAEALEFLKAQWEQAH